MQASNPHLEPLAEGGTLLTWQSPLPMGNQSDTREICFAVRLEPARVQRLISEMGAERAVFTLWNHFRKIPVTPGTIDSERASLEEWAKAVDALVVEIRRREA
jgi:hypothetical protein